MKLALIGFSDLGHYIEDMLEDFHPVDKSSTAYFDDNLHRSSAQNSFPFNEYSSEAFKDHHFYVCLGYKHLKKKNEIISRLIALGRKVPHFVHPSSYVHPSVEIGMGSFVYPGCSIDRNTTIGKGVWIANADVIAHDCAIADCCWFGASVTLSGKVSVGPNTFIGSGTTVSNDVHIGSNVVVGLATAVTKDLADAQSAMGNPMRVLNKPINLI